MNWREQAACLGLDPDMFDADGQGSPAIEGLRVCRGCPVRLECLEEALTFNGDADVGVWGGTTDRRRRDVRSGRMTRGEAMARGDALAARLTAEERAVRDEPWLGAA